MSHLGRLGTIPLVALALAGCGNAAEEARIRQAVADWTHAYESRDVKGYCHKTILSVDLPRSLDERMGIPWGKPGTTSAWDAEYRNCLRTFGKHGEFAADVSDWKVHGIDFGPRAESAGIARTAHVEIRTKSKRAKVWFVKFRGDWKFVVVPG